MMLQFTTQEVETFRAKVKKDDSIIVWLKEKTALVRENPLKIPKQGLADWGLYYYCGDCSVPLTYNFFAPKEHVCPNCKKVYHGEPFDGAWWRATNGLNEQACYYLGLLYICTGELAYAQRAKEILLEYAKYYPDYQEHGNIPYNGPGKANAQTLCESIFLRTLAYGYDLICGTLTKTERECIERDLLGCGAAFLMKHRHNQIHNHEVIANSAIAVIGLITQQESLVDFAVYQKYGLLYQLEHGVLEDGIWFECSLGYHYYALQSFFAYEKFAQHTKHSHVQHPLYKKMFDTALKFLLPDYTHPFINDTVLHHTPLDSHHLLEFAYRAYRTPALEHALSALYKTMPRGDLDAFFYGVDVLPNAPTQDNPLPEYHTEMGSGVTLMRGSNEQYLLFRHSPYGGEHDHYDRLALSYYYNKQPVAADFGTTGYGAYYHYNYFKNTGTHNTVVIDEENHAPSDCKVLAFEKDETHTYVDAMVQWELDYPMPDSFVICQWSDEAYHGVRMRRQIYKTDDFLIDLFHVENVNDKTIDWVFHFNGTRDNIRDATTPVAQFSDKIPFQHLRNVVKVASQETLVETCYRTPLFETRVYSFIPESIALLYADGPSNPTSERIEYMLQRTKGGSARFVNVIATNEAALRVVTNVCIENHADCVIIKLELNGVPKTISIDV